MQIRTRPQTNAVIPPGEYLQEELDAREMTQKELAAAMGRPASKLSQIVQGKKAITPETALELEQALGIPAYMWLAYESEYRLAIARARP